MQKTGKYKYREDEILAELTKYIEGTYGEHYVAGDIQTVDVWHAMGIGPESCQSNIIKYAMRYGKKGGHNKKDLLKIIHYTILLWHFTQEREDEFKHMSNSTIKTLIEDVRL
jgi:hypothetical protein